MMTSAPRDVLLTQENAGHLFKLDLSGEGVRGVPANSYKLA